jgi:hypothetical protein
LIRAFPILGHYFYRIAPPKISSPMAAIQLPATCTAIRFQGLLSETKKAEAK